MPDNNLQAESQISPDSEVNTQISVDSGRQESQVATEYIQKHIDGYSKHNFVGEQLWEAFVDDFENFKTQSDWQRGDNFTVRSLRDMLRSKGVYIPKERGTSTISKHLANLVNSTSFPDWNKEDRDYLKVMPPYRSENKTWRTANSRNKPGYYNHDENLENRYQEAGPSEYYRPRSSAPARQQSILNYNQDNFSHGGQAPQDQASFSRYNVSHNTKQISTLERVYPEKLKYRGDGDTFDYKFHIFMSRCRQSAIPFDETPTAFSVMLTGMALSFYYVHLDQILDPTLDNLCSAMKDRFENFEYRRNQQDAWHELKINDIINMHPEKSLSQCLQIFIEKVDEMKFGLPPGLKNDETVHHKIRSACEDHSAFTTVCDRSASTVNGLISDLQASASRYDRRQLKQRYNRQLEYLNILAPYFQMDASYVLRNHVGLKIIQNMK
ncbi:hypothetical protein OnM2_006007 [Erysiphe neolycopersici]|uniref:Uncharacterized protein n=1 Tax=Erysiphe neolycopersici TaxID=212602 RepID=A0A420I7E7_9PEZI|nr:hypothetical protein OnM2_006007 [Erysiphe neolycopersici]